MTQCIPIRDLKNTAEISEMCRKSNSPITITKNGYSDMVIMSTEVYERMRLYSVYEKLMQAEDDIAEDATYTRLEETPFLYALCQHKLLSRRGYRKVFIRGYLLIYRVDEEQGVVYIERFFSDMEDFEQKL